MRLLSGCLQFRSVLYGVLMGIRLLKGSAGLAQGFAGLYKPFLVFTFGAEVIGIVIFGA